MIQINLQNNIVISQEKIFKQKSQFVYDLQNLQRFTQAVARQCAFVTIMI